MFSHFDRAGELVASRTVEAADAAEIAELLLMRLAPLPTADAVVVGLAWRRSPGRPGLACVWIDEPGENGAAIALMCAATARFVAERIREDPRFTAVLTAPAVLAARLVATADKSEAELAASARKEAH